VFVFTQLGDVERCAPRSGNVHAAGWRGVLEPVIARYRALKRRYFRGDAAFANPGIYEFLETGGTGYAIRGCRPIGSCRTGSDTCSSAGSDDRRTVARGAPLLRQLQLSGAELEKPRRVGARVEWHPG